MEREIAFTLQDLSDMVDVQGITQVMATMQIVFPTLFHEMSKYFIKHEKVKQKGMLQC